MGGVWSTQVEMHFIFSLAWDRFGRHMLRCISCLCWHGIGFVNTSWDAFCVLSGMEWLWSTHVKDTFFVIGSMGCVWSIHASMHFVSLLAWDGYGQQILRCISCPRWQGVGLINTGLDAFWILAGMVWVWTTPVEIHLVFPQAWEKLFNTFWDKFCVLAGMGGVWSTHVQMHLVFTAFMGWFCSIQVELHFVTSLTWGWFDQQRFRCILRPCWHGMGLVNTCWDPFAVPAGVIHTCWDKFCGLAGMGGIWSTHVETHFLSSFLWVGFAQSKLSYILCPRWHGRCLVNARWDIFCLIPGLGGVC